MRAVQKDVNASLFKKQQAEESCRASKLLPRSTRISDANLIRQVLGKKPQVTKFIAKHQLAGHALGVALTVPKKLAKRAVDRNRIKRLMREVFRHSSQNIAQDPELTVFRLRKKIGEKTKGRLRESERQEIRGELKKLMGL
jgi:ribonuclease P protein component